MTELLEDWEPLMVEVKLDITAAAALRIKEYAEAKGLGWGDVARAIFARGLEREPEAQNGHAATAFTCSSCGKDYSAHKRPQPGKRNYCPECRAAGEPQADKARDYRARKREKEDANQ